MEQWTPDTYNNLLIYLVRLREGYSIRTAQPKDVADWRRGEQDWSLYNQTLEMSPSSLYRSFGILCLASLILWWHTLITTLELALRDDEYSHILLVLPISTVLIFVEWRLHKPQPEPNFRAGLALLVIAVVIG